MIILLSLLIFILSIICYGIGYSTGRADGIEWTMDVYDGKYDDQIFNK
jgi:hypothetical protein